MFREFSKTERKFHDAEEMAKGVTEYFEYCEDNKRPVSMARCALFLGFSSRRALYDYEKKSEDFKRVIDFIRSHIQASLEEQVMAGRDGSGVIFMLKNFGYRDDATTEEETPPLEITFEVADAVSNIKITKGKKKADKEKNEN